MRKNTAKANRLKESERLNTLLKIGQTLGEAKFINSAFSNILEICQEEFSSRRSFIITYDSTGEKLRLHTTKGFNAAEFRRFENYLEKSFIQQVFQNNKLIIIPRTDFEPTFLSLFENKTDKSVKTSCICVPIAIRQKVFGAFGVEFDYNSRTNYENLTDFLSISATMIAQAFKVECVVEDEKDRLLAENSDLKRELRDKYDFEQIVGNSSLMKRVYAQVAQVARANTTVLLRGESGTGKELIASAIHYNSLRAKKPFVKVNCAALPDTLIESELFGYEKGAFTGAQTRKKGRFELAEGGTLFLDEIGDLSPATQIKLLRVLQEREFERLGGTETIKSNVRIIAATNKNLEKAIGDGSFREDLFYRLNVFTIFLPPLRERKSDILLLAENFVEKYEREHKKQIKRISTPAIDMLSSYHYPGNVRELENAIERAVLVCDDSVIHGHHLPPTLQTAELTGTIPQGSLTGATEAFERDLIQDALKTTRGNRAKAAKMLDTTERILCYKIKKYDIEPRRFRN